MNIALRFLVFCLLLLMAACSLVGGGSKAGQSIHSPLPVQSPAADTDWPVVTWQLAIAKPASERLLDTTRIAVRPQANELQVYRGAVWTMPPTELVETSVLRVLEDAHRLPGVARSSSGLRADYRLVMDVRRFEADYAGQDLPTATIEVTAKLLHSQTQRVVAAHTFTQQQRAQGTALVHVVPAFEMALGQLSHAVAGWVLQAGQQDRTLMQDSTGHR